MNSPKHLVRMLCLLGLFLAISCSDIPTQTTADYVPADSSPLVTEDAISPSSPGLDPPCLSDFDDDCGGGLGDPIDTGGTGGTGGSGGQGGSGGSGTGNPIGLSLMYLHKGSSTNNLYYTSGNHTSTDPGLIQWHGNFTVNSGAQLNFGPTAVCFNNTVYAFHRGQSTTHLWYSTKPVNSQNWSGNQIIGNQTLSGSHPAAVVFQNTIYVFYAGAGEVIRYSTSQNGSTWVENQEAINSNDPWEAFLSDPYAVVHNNELFIFYVRVQAIPGNGYELVYRRSSDGINWSVPMSTPAETAAAAVSHIGLHIYYTNSNRDLVRSSINPNSPNPTWSTPQFVSSRAKYRPSAISTQGNIIVVYRHADNHSIQMRYSANGGNTWQSKLTLGLSSQPPYLISLH